MTTWAAMISLTTVVVVAVVFGAIWWIDDRKFKRTTPAPEYFGGDGE